MKNRRRELLLFVILLMVLLTSVIPLAGIYAAARPQVVAIVLHRPGLAQVTPPDIVNLPDTIQTLLQYIVTAALAAFGGSPITSFLVGLAKKISFFDRWSGPTLNIVVSLILWVATGLAAYFGFGVQFATVIDFIAQVGPLVTGFIFTMIGSATIFGIAYPKKISIVGYVRTPTPSQTAQMAAA